MRFIPSREDKAGPNAPNRGQTQVQAMEECPPGHVLVIDSRGDARAASAGDLYIGRLKARGCAGIVTDGGLRDSEGILKTGLPAYLRRPTSPPSPIVHQPHRSQPADRLRRRCRLSGRRRSSATATALSSFPPISSMPSRRRLSATTLYDEFAEEEVARGRPLPGLFPIVGPDAKRDFEAWKLKHGRK